MYITAEKAEAEVRAALDEIHAHKWRDVYVPHGFAIRRVTTTEKRNPFAPDVLRDYEVTVQMDVPILYTPDSSTGVLRASLPADTENVDALRDWLAQCLHTRLGRRAGVREWAISPDEAPAPYLPDGKPNGPPADWSVIAQVEVS